MTSVNPPTRSIKRSPFDDDDASEEAPFKTLTRREAQVLTSQLSSLSPWRVVAAQGIVGLGCGAAVWAVTQRADLALSVLYGAATAVIPSAVLARGMTRRTSTNPIAAASGFMFWEMLKIALAMAMLAAAVRVVPDLSWPALLVALVVCMKVSWFAMLWQGKPHKKPQEDV